MPAPTANLPIVGNIVTAEGRNAVLNDALAALYATANPEDRERAEDAADRADLAATASAASATASAASATASAASATEALLSETQAALAALAAGAPIVTSLTDPVPATGTVELLKLDAGLQVHEVVAGAWVLRGWLVGPTFDTVAQLLASTAATLGSVGQIVAYGTHRGRVTDAANVRSYANSTGYDLITDGGAKLHVMPSVYTLFDLGAWGPNPNGTFINSALFERAALAVKEYGGGAVWVPPVDVGAGEYYRVDRPTDIPSFVFFEGAGPASLIFNDRVSPGGVFGDHAVFNPGNFHPIFYNLLTYATLADVGVGDRTVTVAAGSFTEGAFPPETNVVLRGGAEETGGGGGEYSTYAWQRLNRIVSSNAATGVITLMYPVDEAVTAPEIAVTDDQVASGGIAYSDETARNAFVSYKSGIRNLAVKSNSLWTANTATLDCLFENLHITARRGLYGNSFCHTAFRNITAIVNEMAIEWSAASHDSYVDGFDVTVRQLIATNTNFAIIGEHAKNIRVRNFTFNADNLESESAMFQFVYSKDIVFENGLVYCRNFDGTGILWQSSSSAGIENHRNGLRSVKFFGGCKTRPFTVGSVGVNNGHILDDVEWIGETSDNAALLVGNNHSLHKVKFSKPGLQLDIRSTSSSNSEIVDCHFPNGFAINTGAEYQRHKIARNTTDASRLCQTGLVRSFTRDAVSATAANTVYRSGTFPATSLKGGDRIRAIIRGNVSAAATTAAKELRFTDGSVNYGSLTFAIGESGTFSIDATIIVDGNTVLVGYTSREKSGVVITTRAAVTGLSLNVNPRTFSVQAWTGNAAETILIDQCEIWVEKIGQYVRP